MLSGRCLSVRPVRSDGGVPNDFGSSWTLAACGMDSFQLAVWATTGAGTNVTEVWMRGRAAWIANWRGMGMVSSR